MLIDLSEKIRDEPHIRKPNAIPCWHDWRKDDYTRFSNEINYCKINHMELPDKPGIYFFYSQGNLMYIGRAKSLRKRVGTHISINKHIIKAYQPHQIDVMLHRVDKVEVEVYPEQELDWIESFYMTRLGPSLNALSWKHANL